MIVLKTNIIPIKSRGILMKKYTDRSSSPTKAKESGKLDHSTSTEWEQLWEQLNIHSVENNLFHVMITLRNLGLALSELNIGKEFQGVELLVKTKTQKQLLDSIHKEMWKIQLNESGHKPSHASRIVSALAESIKNSVDQIVGDNGFFQPREWRNRENDIIKQSPVLIKRIHIAFRLYAVRAKLHELQFPEETINPIFIDVDNFTKLTKNIKALQESQPGSIPADQLKSFKQFLLLQKRKAKVFPFNLSINLLKQFLFSREEADKLLTSSLRLLCAENQNDFNTEKNKLLESLSLEINNKTVDKLEGNHHELAKKLFSLAYVCANDKKLKQSVLENLKHACSTETNDDAVMSLDGELHLVRGYLIELMPISSHIKLGTIDRVTYECALKRQSIIDGVASKLSDFFNNGKVNNVIDVNVRSACNHFRFAYEATKPGKQRVNCYYVIQNQLAKLLQATEGHNKETVNTCIEELKQMHENEDANKLTH